MFHTGRKAALTLALALGAPAAWALDPSFDCSKAASEAEQAVCASDALASLDLELARLYRLAESAPGQTKAGRDSLHAMQRGWIKGRDECWKSSLGVPLCAANEYSFRIYYLRRDHAEARAEEGASLGPFEYACDGMEAPLSAVFVNTQEPAIVLRWGDNAIVLPRVPSGSGAKYEGAMWADGPSLFWEQGGEARFAPPGGEEAVCKLADIG